MTRTSTFLNHLEFLSEFIGIQVYHCHDALRAGDRRALSLRLRSPAQAQAFPGELRRASRFVPLWQVDLTRMPSLYHVPSCLWRWSTELVTGTVFRRGVGNGLWLRNNLNVQQDGVISLAGSLQNARLGTVRSSQFTLAVTGLLCR